MHVAYERALPTPDIGQSAFTTRRRSVRSTPVEIITRGERRRSWTLEQKSEIVAESLGPDLTPTQVAQIRNQLRSTLHVAPRTGKRAASSLVSPTVPRFARVELISAPTQPATAPKSDNQPCAAVASPPPSTGMPGGRMEITLPGVVILRVDADVDGTALRRVLAVLDRR
jgi:transposase